MGLRTRIKSKGLKVARRVLGHMGRGESDSEIVSNGPSSVEASEIPTEEPESQETVATTSPTAVVEPSVAEMPPMLGNYDIGSDTDALEEELAQAAVEEPNSSEEERIELGPEGESTTEFTSTEEKKTEWPPQLEGQEAESVRAQIIENIQTIFDPEIPVNIYELGLIYEVNIHEGMAVNVIMTLTSPNCPAAQSLPLEVKIKTEDIEKVTSAEVDIVWDPVWGPHLMSEAARLELNL